VSAKNEIRFADRPLAFTDVESTGLFADRHETIDIGLVLADQRTLEIIDRADLRVKPEHIETASPRALEINGYNQRDWADAMSLGEAMAVYGPATQGAVFAAWNVTLDWSFIAAGFRKTGVENLMDYHRIDLWTLAWSKLKDTGLASFSMKDVAPFLGIPEEPSPHRGVNGAMCAYEVYRKLMGR
jgi:DNA polymerase-3 subunit epsilon